MYPQAYPPKRPSKLSSDGFPPVETVHGEQYRLEGIRLLTVKHAALASRAAKRQPTSLERRDLSELERSLAALEAMAPAGDLSPARAIGREV